MTARPAISMRAVDPRSDQRVFFLATILVLANPSAS